MAAERPVIEYYFSFVSLWSYVGGHVFRDLVRRHNAIVEFKPIDLLAAFDAGGSKKVRERPMPRQLYRIVEMQRWRARYKIPLTIWPKYYPVDPSLGHRMLLAAIRDGSDVFEFAYAGTRAVWADEIDVADPDTLVRIADASGLNGKKLLAQAQDPDLKQREDALTREAAERNLFGAPFYLYRGEPFWGQDRLDMLDEAIASGRAPVPWPDVRDIDPKTATIK